MIIPRLTFIILFLVKMVVDYETPTLFNTHYLAWDRHYLSKVQGCCDAPPYYLGNPAAQATMDHRGDPNSNAHDMKV